jgi:hypothetical protein
MQAPSASNECFERYTELVKQSKWRAVVFRRTPDESEIVVEKCIAAGEGYETFLNSFPTDDIRWCLLDFPYKTTNFTLN